MKCPHCNRELNTVIEVVNSEYFDSVHYDTVEFECDGCGRHVLVEEKYELVEESIVEVG